ncbi:DUF1450 domain-containing protein [Halorhabdus amylolytica]|uniref:DUF1450 domain-containing protein n=1 Tax=Halorhabdus amylolytica TaxID=2559573 RepID=UPI00145A5FBB|nr:DUF1450 domain-containing protein [Halorhabdus amylolytica]
MEYGTGADKYDPADDGVDQGDDVRRFGDVCEGEDEQRDNEQRAGKDENDRDGRTPFADPLQQPFSKALLLHRSFRRCVARGDKVPDGRLSVAERRVDGELNGDGRGGDGGLNGDERRETSGSKTAGEAADGRESGPTVVEYCVNNVTPDVRERLATASVDSRGLPCLERCGVCRTDAFLVVDGELCRADGHGALLAALPGVSP